MFLVVRFVHVEMVVVEMTSDCFLPLGRGLFAFMNTKYDKPFKTYSEQIQIIKSRNIIVNNIEFATEVVKSKKLV